jgi:curved DNA-binding protein CbpA
MASSSSSNAKIGDPSFDPYDILGIEIDGASDSAITKAYRQLALKLHPDKIQHLSEKEQERISREFHAIQEARAFLLEPEHAEERRAFDTKRASQRRRRQQDAMRESQMSERRKRMRDELKRKEEANQTVTSNQDKEVLKKLRKEGKDLREKHYNRTQERQARKKNRAEKKARELIEDRQVRLRWSRKRMKVSPSEHSLAQLMSNKFGPVESVEILGSKGNSALITFQNASSCRPCVDAYEISEEMRATFVGKRKEQYEEELLKRHSNDSPQMVASTKVQDRERLQERVHRQAEERERLAREMELEDAGHAEMTKAGTQPSQKKFIQPFPSEFGTEVKGDAPLQKLEHAERSLFADILLPDQMKQMQVTPR